MQCCWMRKRKSRAGFACSPSQLLRRTAHYNSIAYCLQFTQHRRLGFYCRLVARPGCPSEPWPSGASLCPSVFYVEVFFYDHDGGGMRVFRTQGRLQASHASQASSLSSKERPKRVQPGLSSIAQGPLANGSQNVRFPDVAQSHGVMQGPGGIRAALSLSEVVI
jgi:hypothetical protein